MFEEINSDYLLRNITMGFIYCAMMIQPSDRIKIQQVNASARISLSFLELLERQFPIDETHQKMNLRTASEFADHMAIHVNILNSAVKELTRKTTSQLIAKRVLQESKILLKHSSWNVSEIAFALSFSEVTHFNNSFKMHTEKSPLRYRNT
jgi:AraC family transcriptional regulator, transcriptional activator of pobA